MSAPNASEAATVEFTALRATIRERGTVRMVIAWLTLVAWSALAVALLLGGASTGNAPLFTLFPLLVLAAGFEVVLALHVGVERIGRYLHVFHEGRAGWTGWEQIAMSFGARHPGGVDPLFTWPFLLAILLNLLPALLIGVPIELAFLGGAHALVAVHVLRARQVAGRQRGVDLDRFRALLRDLDRPDR